MKKLMSEIKINDFLRCPVWEWDLDSDDDCTLISIEKYPVSELSNRIIGIYCKTNSNEDIFCIISNISLESPSKTDLFISLSILDHEREFYLARYFDVDYGRNGPEGLCKWLNKKVEDVFPITWDISNLVSNNSLAKKGSIKSSVENKLSRDEIIKLTLT